MARQKKDTGMGADAFFQTTPVPERQPSPDALEEEKPERRSFNLKPSTLRLLDEIQIKTIRGGDKWTLSAIVARGITLVAAEMGVDEQTGKRVDE